MPRSRAGCGAGPPQGRGLEGTRFRKKTEGRQPSPGSGLETSLASAKPNLEADKFHRSNGRSLSGPVLLPAPPEQGHKKQAHTFWKPPSLGVWEDQGFGDTTPDPSSAHSSSGAPFCPPSKASSALPISSPPQLATPALPLSGSLTCSCGHTCCDADPFTSNNPTRWNPVPLSVLALSVTEPFPASLTHIFSHKNLPRGHLRTLGPAGT